MKQYEALEKIFDENKDRYTILDVARTFADTLEGLEKTSNQFQAAKAKFSEGEWNGFINGLTMSFFVSLHVSKMKVADALKFAEVEGLNAIGVVERSKK